MTRLGDIEARDQLTGTLLRESSPGSAAAVTVDLRSYLNVALKHKWSILLVTMLAAILAFIYASSLVPRYSANVTMLYDPPSTSNYGTVTNLAAANYNGYFRGNRMFKSQLLIVRSKSFSEKMVDQYKLWDHRYFKQDNAPIVSSSGWRTWLAPYLPEWFPWFDMLSTAPATTDEKLELQQQRRNNAVNTVRGGISISSEEEVMMLTLGFNSSSADFATEMANKLAEFYSQYELEQRMELYNQANTWLVDRTRELRDQLMGSERALQEFKSKEDVGLAGGRDSINSKRLEVVFTDLSESRRRVQSLSQTLARLQRKNNNFSQSVNSDALLKFTGVRAAMEAEMEVRKQQEQLALEYGPKHPKMIAAQSNLDRLQQKLTSEIKLVVVELRADLNTARSDVLRYSNELDGLKSQTQSLQNQTFRLATLERARDTDQQLYDLFVTRFKELSVDSNVNTPSIRILNYAQKPGAPYWPNKKLIISIWSLLVFAIAIGLAFLQEFLDNTIKTADEVEDKLGLPLLGSLVHLEDSGKNKDFKAETFFVDNIKSPFAESIRTIRTGVMLSGLDDPYKVIAISSTVPGEGKTTVSLNLACALGKLEKVLIIDADMRRAAIGPHFGIARNTKGLADVVAGLNKFQNCVLRFKKGNIDILPAGTIPPNPQELLSSNRFRQIIEMASKVYDRVIIDTPPTHLVSDPKLVARCASAVIYVVKADATSANLVTQEIWELKKSTTPIVGVVLNSISKRKMRGLYRYGRYRKKGGYGYGYDYGYGTGYGYGSGYGDDSDHAYGYGHDTDEPEPENKPKRRKTTKRKLTS